MEPVSASSNFYSEKSLSTPTLKTQKFEGFDFLRAFFSIAIVGYKTKIFYIPKLLFPGYLPYFLSDYVLSGMVGALAVPVFLQISLFLFYTKSKNIRLGYFIQKRLPRLISLYLFWVTSITLFDILFVDGFASFREATSSVKQIILFIVSGNNTPYFFFFSLLFVTVIAEILVLLFSRLKNISIKRSITYFLLIASCFLIFSFSAIEPFIKNSNAQSSLLHGLNSLIVWDYNPLNFLPYIFTAAITAQEYNEGKLEGKPKFLKFKLYNLFALTLIFFVLEWLLTSNQILIQVDQAPLDHYMRLSLVFGSWWLLYLALFSKQKVPAWVKFLSDCSLGIYGFHVFFTFKRPIPFSSLPVIGGLFQAVPILQSITAFSVALGGSIALTLLAKRIKFFKRFV